MAESQRDKIKALEVDEINQAYRNGGITAGRKNALMRKKAQISMEDMEINTVKDYLGGYWAKMVETGQQGWDKVVEVATRDTKDEVPVLSDLLQSLKASWGIAQIIFAPISALGEMNGELVRRLALTAGASPGWARVLGFVADASTGIVAQGAMNKGMKFATGDFGIRGLAKAGYLGETFKDIATKGATAQGELRFAGTAAEATGSALKSKAVAATAKQGDLPLSGSAAEATGDMLKGTLTPDALKQALLEKMKASGKEITEEMNQFLDRHVKDLLKIQEGQMELPLRAMAAGLEEEAVPMAKIVEQWLQLKKLAPNVAKVGEAAHQGATQFALDLAKYAKSITIEQAEKEIPGLARKLGIDYAQLKNVTPGGFYDPKNLFYENPKKMYAYLKALEPHVGNIQTLAKASMEGGEVAQAAFARYMTSMFTTDVSGNPQYTKGFVNMLPHWAPEEIAAGNIPAALRK